MNSDKVKILFVWTGVTSYMPDCWRALAERFSDVELRIVIDRANTAGGLAFDETRVLHGLNYALVDGQAQSAFDALGDWVPDVAFIVGWRSVVCRAFAESSLYEPVAKVLVFDMPWEWKVRKFVARFLLAQYLRRFAACYVPGARARRYARWLGFSDSHIFTGLFSVKEPPEEISRNHEESLFFLYVGRFSSEKRIRKLAEAYQRYRERCGGTPWKLVCCGKGVEAHWLEGQPGVEMRGFLQPDEVHALQRQAGALVLTSSFDPWPLVILESVSVGVPVICTPACGDHIELIGTNGIVTNNTTAAMLEMTNNYNKYASAAKLAIERAHPYWSSAWAQRTYALAATVLNREGDKNG